MAENSKIEWTTHTFNPWIGCQKVGPGCDHCYAEIWDARGAGEATRWGPQAARSRTRPSNWAKPRQWNQAAAGEAMRPRVFCASLADVFDTHASVQDGWRRDLGALILATPNLDWMLLTKRISNGWKVLPVMFPHGVPDNVWIGASIVTQGEADRDASRLHQLKVAMGLRVSFMSMEPLLGPVVLDPRYMPDLVICGGESGAKARPMHPDWARAIRDQCVATRTPYLFKQWGEWLPYGEQDAEGSQNSVTLGEKAGLWHEWPEGQGFSVRVGKRAAGRLLDGRTWDEMPAGLAAERKETAHG